MAALMPDWTTRKAQDASAATAPATVDFLVAVPAEDVRVDGGRRRGAGARRATRAPLRQVERHGRARKECPGALWLRQAGYLGCCGCFLAQFIQLHCYRYWYLE